MNENCWIILVDFLFCISILKLVIQGGSKQIITIWGRTPVFMEVRLFSYESCFFKIVQRSLDRRSRQRQIRCHSIDSRPCFSWIWAAASCSTEGVFFMAPAGATVAVRRSNSSFFLCLSKSEFIIRHPKQVCPLYIVVILFRIIKKFWSAKNAESG